ncbi:hypothetical protein AtubIFM57258_010251 [Aspergillus tubingensis]|nr:hypothetical protein AtubIFM57258_010251 [Aspergillus tubingensis]
MSKIEQENRLGTDIPSTDQYLAYRLGTNLMGVICAATDTNDILSLKKEIHKGEVYSLIPVLLNQAKSPQTAIDISIQILKDSFADLDRIEAEIVARSDQMPLKFLIESCRHYCAGFIEWRFVRPFPGYWTAFNARI